MITEVNLIGLTPLKPSNNFFKELEDFFKEPKKALIVRVLDSHFSKNFKEKIISVSQENESIVIFNSRNILNKSSNIHLTSEDLMLCKDRPNKNFILGASCHNINEIKKANLLECDYVLISPVMTNKYQNKKLGWKGFKKMAEAFNGPSYALGGMQVSDIDVAIKHKGQGIAGISCFFRD